MRILLTNDDGIRAVGLSMLHRAATGLGELHVVAPSWVRSACGHGVTFHRPLSAWRQSVVNPRGERVFEGFAVDGLPSDCVKLGVGELVGAPIDLVLSGINSGCNLGIHTIYSGTVAAAREAALMGLPAIAVSLHIGDRSKTRWERASESAADVLRQVVPDALAPGTLLNVNIPILDDGSEPQGLRVVPASAHPMVDRYIVEPPEGHKALQARPVDHVGFAHRPPETDVGTLFERYVTLTPLRLDPTDHEQLAVWQQRLGVGQPPRVPGAQVAPQAGPPAIAAPADQPPPADTTTEASG